MIKKFAQLTLSGRLPAFAVVFGFLALALVFPLASIVSGAVLVCVTLQAGLRNGAMLVAMAALALAIVCYVFVGNPVIGLYAAIAQLVPCLLLAAIFRNTRSLDITLQAAALIGALAFIVIDMALPANALFWQQVLKQILEPIFLAANMPQVDVESNIATVSEYMTGIMIVSIVLVHSSLIFLGYWLNCVAHDCKQYKEDFKNIRLGKVLALLAIGLASAAVVLQSSYLAQLSGILTILFCIPGMSFIHTLCDSMTNSKLWLIISYLLIVFVPQAIVIIILLGLFETFFGLRNKINRY